MNALGDQTYQLSALGKLGKMLSLSVKCSNVIRRPPTGKFRALEVEVIVVV